MQHKVLSLCKQFVVACRCTVCTDRPPRTLLESDSTICCMYTVYPPEDEHLSFETCKSKGVPRQAEAALGVPGRLRPRIISTFGTTRVVGRQPYARAAFTPGEVPGTHFQRLSRPQGTWFCRKEPRKKSPVSPTGIDPGTVRLVAQRLNHYATPGPSRNM